MRIPLNRRSRQYEFRSPPGLSNLRAWIEESGAVITNDELPIVQWREVHIIQVLQNLICNAVNYRHDSRPFGNPRLGGSQGQGMGVVGP